MAVIESSGLVWLPFAVMASLFFAWQIDANRHARINGFFLTTLRSFWGFVLFLPLLPFMEWSVNPVYYIAIIIIAAVTVLGASIQYNLAFMHNGRVAAMDKPLVIFFNFVFWVGIDKTQQAYFAENPEQLIGIATGFIIFLLSLLSLRKSDAGWRSFVVIMPVSIMYAVTYVATKLVLQDADMPLELTLNFIFLTNLVMFMLAMPIYLSRRSKEDVITALSDRGVLKGSVKISALYNVSWVFISLALIYADNPAYPTVITAMVPLYLMVYYLMRKQKDEANPMAGMMMVLSAVLIILFSSFR